MKYRSQTGSMRFAKPRRNLIRPAFPRPRQLRSYEQITFRLRQGKRCIERRRQMIHDKPVLHHHMARELCESSEQVPMASAPVIVNRISTSCGNILPPKARIRPTAIVAPTMAVNGTLKGRDKAWAKYPSTGAVTADTITLKTNAIAAPSPNSQRNPPRATTSLSVAPKSPSTGPNNMNTNVLFIEDSPSPPGFERLEAAPE